MMPIASRDSALQAENLGGVLLLPLIGGIAETGVCVVFAVRRAGFCGVRQGERRPYEEFWRVFPEGV
jgi:hypothetical protein